MGSFEQTHNPPSSEVKEIRRLEEKVAAKQKITDFEVSDAIDKQDSHLRILRDEKTRAISEQYQDPQQRAPLLEKLNKWYSKAHEALVLKESEFRNYMDNIRNERDRKKRAVAYLLFDRLSHDVEFFMSGLRQTNASESAHLDYQAYHEEDPQKAKELRNQANRVFMEELHGESSSPAIKREEEFQKKRAAEIQKEILDNHPELH